MRFLYSMLAAGLIFLPCERLNAKSADLSSVLKSYTATGGWKAIFSDDQWILGVVPVNLDNSEWGQLLVSPPVGMDRSAWDFQMLRLKDESSSYPTDVGTTLSCKPYDLYSMRDEDGSCRTIAMNAEFHVEGKGACAGDLALSLHDGKLKAESVSIGASFRENESCREVMRLSSRIYLGYEMQRAYEHDWMAGFKPKGEPSGACKLDSRLLGKLMSEIDGYVDKTSNTQEVAIVAVDENNDGATDFFLTSETFRLKSGKCVWRLYRSNGGKFEKTERTVIAGSTDFCRVLSYTTNPRLVVLGATGCSPEEIRSLIADRYFHRLERLPCRRYTIHGRSVP